MIVENKILQENIKRNNILDAPYNPITGEGSPIKREKVTFSDFGEPMYLPLDMINIEWIQQLLKFNALNDAANHLRIPFNTVLSQFVSERFKHDFEFWCASTVKIKPKMGGDFIPFVLNAPQREMHLITYEQIVKGLPIRQILLKSRQFGGSTYYQILMSYIQIIQKTNWNSLIAAHFNQAATNIRFMLSTMAKYYPEDIDSSFTLKSFESTKNIKFIPERSCKITVGSIETPDSIRADDVALSHLSEVGLWKKTEGKSPADLCQSILGTIPTVAWSMYVLESTAKGVGNFFNTSWENAISGKNGLTPVFIGWFKDPKNRISFKNDEERLKFYNSFSTYDEFLWKSGATLEGIKFYHFKFAEMEGDEWRIKSEFPTTAAEAFQSTGQKVFSPSYTQAIKQDCVEPEFKGEVFAVGRRGKDALENIRFDETPKGNLWIWTMPDKSEKIEHRYCAFADIGGRTNKADYSVIKVIDRYWIMEDGDPEVVAVWHGHLDQDLFAWKCAQICSMYDNALLAIESNSLNKEDSEGEHFLTILDEISPYYKNLYTRNDLEKVNDDYIPRYGFHTNVKTKTMILNSLNAAARERYLMDTNEKEGYSYVERDARAVYEMEVFETKPNGKQGATDGAHDDMVIVTAGAVWLATSYMPKPYIKQFTEIKSQRTRNESSF